MSDLNKEAPVFYMAMEDNEHLNHGAYNSRENAAIEALEIRKQMIANGEKEPQFYTVCRIIPSLENTIQQTEDLPEKMQEWIDEWINDNVEGGTEDGVIEIQGGATAVLQAALIDVLTNHSIYLGNGAAAECVETKFDISEGTHESI